MNQTSMTRKGGGRAEERMSKLSGEESIQEREWSKAL